MQGRPLRLTAMRWFGLPSSVPLSCGRPELLHSLTDRRYHNNSRILSLRIAYFFLESDSMIKLIRVTVALFAPLISLTAFSYGADVSSNLSVNVVSPEVTGCGTASGSNLTLGTRV